MAGLKVIQEFLKKSENNKYGTPVYILEQGWNLTAGVQGIPKVDNYFHYSEIVKIINKILDGVNSTWATNNPTDAECYFTEGYIPFEAIQDLGFPASKVMTGVAGVGN